MITDFPELYCPFEPMINPFVEGADAHTVEWLLQYNLLPKGEPMESFLKNKYALLCGRSFPTGDYDLLCIASDLYTHLFLLDDPFDHVYVGKKAQERKKYLTAVVDAMLEITIDGKTKILATDPFVTAFDELWRRIRKKTTPEWQVRFSRDLKKTLECGLWEYDGMLKQHIPTVAEVLENRQYGSGANLGTDFVELTENAALTVDVLQNEKVRNLTYLARVLVCWANDLYSVNRELKCGDRFSLVLAVHHEQNLKLEDAIQEVAKIHDDEMRQFLNLEQQLPSFNEEIDEKIRCYVKGLRYYVRGNIDWSISDTKRYGLVDLNLG